MAETANKFDEVNRELTAMLKKLMGELAGLQTAWVGAGAQAFEKVKNQYEQNLINLNQVLEETSASIRSSGAHYESSDSSAASMITKSGGGGYSLPLEN